MKRTARPLAAVVLALALGACYVQVPPSYQSPPPLPQTYASPPQASYVPPPAPVYTPPEPDGTYVNLNVVPPSDPAPTIDVFYDSLAPYGRWEYDPGLGRVWIPSNPSFEPYHDGYWQVTDYGFTWISNEPFGWAVYHYGRWTWRGRWAWIPNNVWGPAWVQWREADGYTGWAPLPPDNVRTVIPEERWHFVPTPDVTRVDVVNVYSTVDPRVLYRSSRPLVRYTRTPRGEIFVAGPDPVQLRTRYNVNVVPTALPPQLAGRYQQDAWRDRRVREQGFREEEAQWRRQRDEQLRQQAERRRIQEEQQRIESQRRQFEDQQRRATDERERRRLADDQQRMQEQLRRLQEQQRSQEEQQRRFAEEQRRLQEQQRWQAEQQRQADDQRRAQEQQRQQQMAQEQQRRQAEQQRQVDDQRRAQEQQHQQQMQQEQQRRQTEQQRRQREEQPKVQPAALPGRQPQQPLPQGEGRGRENQNREKGKNGKDPNDEGNR